MKMAMVLEIERMVLFMGNCAKSLAGGLEVKYFPRLFADLIPIIVELTLRTIFTINAILSKSKSYNWKQLNNYFIKMFILIN